MFLEHKGQGFDGCDAVRLFDYMIYYEDNARNKNIDEQKQIRLFVNHMKYGSYVYHRLTEDQKRTWTEFKQNLLEEYKKEETMRMSWSVPRYPPQKRELPDVKVRDDHNSSCKTEKPEPSTSSVASRDVDSQALIDRQKRHRRCYNCKSATHLVKVCRVPPAFVCRGGRLVDSPAVERRPETVDGIGLVRVGSLRDRCEDLDFASGVIAALRLWHQRRPRRLPSNWRARPSCSRAVGFGLAPARPECVVERLLSCSTSVASPQSLVRSEGSSIT